MPFRDVVGHRRLLQLLGRSVRRDSLPPSLIFGGPDGVGKRLTAIATAQALNCIAPLLSDAPGDFELDACGICAACTRIARNVHPDILIVEPGDTGSIKIDQVREIVDRAAYRPFEGSRRVVVVDEADALVPAAQNALLKTLEEPPASSVFILVTSRPDSLLQTVRSRCPRLNFRPLGPGDVAAALRARGVAAEQARAAAATANGGVARALEASADDYAEAREIARQTLADASAAHDPRRRIEGAKTLLANTGGTGAEDREQLSSYLRAMESLLRDCELLASRADAAGLANSDVQPELERLAKVYSGERGARAFAAVDEALKALSANAGVKVVADWVVLHL